MIRLWNRFFIEITNRCDFDCVFCPSGISERPRTDMDREAAFDLIDQLQRLGFQKAIYFHVLGEPLLHPHVFPIVDRAAEAGMVPVLFTNGGGLTEDVVRRILACKAAEVLISMQTVSRQSYEMLRTTPLDYAAYLGKIQRALALAESHNTQQRLPRLRVSVGVKKNDPDHPDDGHFVEESIADVKRSIAAIFGQVKGADLSGVWRALDDEGLSGTGAIPVTGRLAVSVRRVGNWRRMWGDTPVSSGRCPHFGKELAVLSNGWVTLCHLDYDGRARIGDATERPLSEIIASPQLRQMSEDFLAGKSVPRGCRYCRALVDA
jgi:organic radical activating enzyme